MCNCSWIRGVAALTIGSVLALGVVRAAAAEDAAQGAPQVVRGAPHADGSPSSGPDLSEATRLFNLGTQALSQKPPKPQEALKWFRQASDKGSPAAPQNIGAMYAAGFGVPKHLSAAARWSRSGAERGFAPAQNSLGQLYENGQGVPQDFAEALKWYRLAADQKHAGAQSNLGNLYMLGRGVAANPAEGMRLYRLGADQGNAAAQANLGLQYAAGKAVAQNDAAAYFWLNLAAARLPANAAALRDQVARARDGVARRLAPAELERMQHLAGAWKPGSPDVPGDAPSSGSAARGPQTASTTAAPAPPSGGQPSPRGSGTGFVITQSGFVLTNNHVVAQCTEVRARHAGDPLGTLTSIARDPQNDLALLKLPARFAEPASFREGGIRLGDAVVVYGFPLVGMLASQGNLTTGSVSALAGLGNDSRMLQISAPVQPGNSGGPLLDSGGNVVGVINSKLNTLRTAAATGDVPQNVNFAIKATVARTFLDANNVDYRTAGAARELKTADVADRAKKFTLLIECWR
jgi:TPR repeat protein